MADLIAYLRSADILIQGLFLAIGGFAGVFVVMTLFFYSIKILETLFKAKKEQE